MQITNINQQQCCPRQRENPTLVPSARTGIRLHFDASLSLLAFINRRKTEMPNKYAFQRGGVGFSLFNDTCMQKGDPKSTVWVKSFSSENRSRHEQLHAYYCVKRRSMAEFVNTNWKAIRQYAQNMAQIRLMPRGLLFGNSKGISALAFLRNCSKNAL